jgi:hypothetical protein
MGIGVSIGVLGMRLIFQSPIQNFELRDLNPGRCECLVGCRRFAHLEWAYRFQNAVGARFQVERRFAGGESVRIFGKARQGVEDLAALSAPHLAARGAQHFRR